MSLLFIALVTNYSLVMEIAFTNISLLITDLSAQFVTLFFVLIKSVARQLPAEDGEDKHPITLLDNCILFYDNTRWVDRKI